MSLLTPAQQEIEKIFRLRLVKLYVTDKLDDEEDEEPDLPEKKEDQSDDEWRQACIDAEGVTAMTDPIFRADGQKKMEKAQSYGGQILVEGAPYVVFVGAMSKKTLTAFKEDYGKPCTPRSVDNSLRHLAKKKHGEVKNPEAAARPNRNRPQASRGGRGNGRGGNWQGNRGRGGWQPNGYQGNFGSERFYSRGPWRPNWV
jgi:hypothetical protein